VTFPDKNHEISSVVLVEKSLGRSAQLAYPGGSPLLSLVYRAGGTEILPDKDVDK